MNSKNATTTVRGTGVPVTIESIGFSLHPRAGVRPRLRLGPSAFGAAALTLGCMLACAADPDPSAAPTLGEITVTANKYQQNIQTVPASVTVLTSDILERSNVRDFEDIATAVPSLTVTQPSQPGNDSINIRGIGTYAYSVSAESSVAVVVDDIPQAFQATAFSALSDVKQVEVLNGPQSTLFGKATSAGVVNITTNDPTSTFSGSLDALGTDDGEQDGTLILSGPLTEGLETRVVASYDHYRGTLHDIPENRWIDGNTDATFRGKLIWKPGEDWTVTLEPWYSRVRSSCCQGAEYFLSPGVTYGKPKVPQTAILDGVVPGPDNRNAIDDVTARGNATDGGSGLKIVHPLGAVTLTSITSYDHYALHDLQDTDGSAFNFSTVQPGSPPGGSANGGFFHINFVTQELRLTSAPGAALTYVGGLFYSYVDGDRYFVRGSNTLGTYGVNPATGLPYQNLPTSNSTTYASYLSKSMDRNVALFGQATYQFVRHWFVTGGLRLNREDISYQFYDFGNGLSYGVPSCSTKTSTPGVSAQTCNSNTSETGKFALQYQPVESFMTFADYARGYKGMAYDLTSSLTTRTPIKTGADAGVPQADAIAAHQPVPAETVDSFEVGYKATLLGQRLLWDVTAFDEVFHGFQAQSRDPYTGLNVLNSIGRVTTRGVESQLNSQLGRLSLNNDVIYDQAVMNVFPGAACYTSQDAAHGCVGGVQDLSGKPLPNAPKWKVTGSGRYEIPFADDRFGAFLVASYVWQSRVIYDLKQDPDSVQRAYGIVDLSLGATDYAHWTVTAFVNDLFDRSYAVYRARDGIWNISPYGVTPTDAIGWTPGRDSRRYYGMKVSLKF